LVEPGDTTALFWQSGVLDLEPIVSATRREASLLVAAGTIFPRIVPLLPPDRASGEYRWRTVFDTSVVNGNNAERAESDVAAVQKSTARALPDAQVQSDFGGIVADYRQRLSIARAPILLLLCEIAGLALIYIAWTAAFQAEATADERAVMSARGAGVRQIAGIGAGEAALLAVGAALAGIPLALVLLRITANLGPVGALARTQGLRLTTTPDAANYAVGAAFVGLLALALPAIPAARRSIVALRQGDARPATAPLWQRTGLDIALAVVAIVALLQFQRQGGMLQQLRGRFVVDPFLLIAPLLVLVSGALLFLRLYPWLLTQTRRATQRMRGLPLSLALVQLTRNRAASTRLVLLLTLAVALGLFAQTFGATVALNQRQRAGYMVGADGRAILTSTEPLLKGTLPAGVQSAWALRTTIKAAGASGSAGELLAVDPEHIGAVAFNPKDRPVAPVAETLAALGPTPPPDGIVMPGQPRNITFTIDLNNAPFQPGVILSDAAGRYHRMRLTGGDPTAPQAFGGKIDLPAAAYPVRLVTLAFLPNNTIRWGLFENTKPPVTITVGAVTVDGTVVEAWDDSHRWEARSDTTFDPGQELAGVVEIGPSGEGSQPVEITLARGMRAALLRAEPHEVEPVPVRANQAFLRANSLEAGDSALFFLRNRPVLVQIEGVVEHFPSLGIDGAPFVVAHGPRLLQLLNASFFRPVTPNELWLELPDDPGAAEQVRGMRGIGGVLLQTETLRSFSRDPLAIGVAGVFFLGFVTSVGLTALGFAIATYLAGRRRRLEFAVLQALGLTQRAVLLILAVEQAVLVALALVAGTVLGVALGRLIVPLMAISDRGHATVPPYQVVVPWATLGLTYLTLIVVFSGMTVLVLALLLRRGIGSALRIGEG
jgi:hypothetical protein